MRIIEILVGVVVVGNLQPQPLRTFTAESVDRSARRIPAIFDVTGTLPPHWSGQSLIGVQDNNTAGPLIYLIDREGRRDHFSFTISDAALINVHGLASLSDGTVAITGGAVSGDSRAGSFLALVGPDREYQTVVRTWPYVAWDVTFVPDGSLWTVGYTLHETETRIVKPNVMSHFDRNGRLLTSAELNAQSRFGPSQSAALQHSFLRASSDRIGWFTNGLEYIEFSFDGREIDRYQGPEVPDFKEAALWGSFALSDGNEVLFNTVLFTRISGVGGRRTAKRATWTLDRKERQWVPVDIEDSTLAADAEVFGFDNGFLVTAGALHEMRRYKTTRMVANH
jgi:hypothetical protein